jgi:2-isopropylmalate synthase
VEDYTIRSVTGGAEAMGEVTVSVSCNGRIIRGRGVSTDIIEASAKAFLDALNRLAIQQDNHKEREPTV